MNLRDEELPPPYIPPGTTPISVLVKETSFVPRWIVVYAMIGKPLLWVVHRFANALEAYDERGKDNYYDLATAFALWGLGSLVIVAIVYAGGAHAWAKPTDRPRLLRFGLGCSLAWSVLMVGLAILVLGAALSNPSSPTGRTSGTGDTAVWVAALVWVAGVVAEGLAWRRLGRIAFRR